MPFRVRPPFRSPFRWALGCLTWAGGAAACLQAPNGANATSNTQVAVGQVVPGPASATTGSGAGAILAGDLNRGLNVGGRPPSTPAISHVEAVLTVSPMAAPALCLAAAADAVGVGLQLCSGEAAQKWVWVNGLLQGDGGRCLAVDAKADNAATLAPCDANSSAQQILRTGASLAVVAKADGLLQVDGFSPSTTSKIRFGALGSVPPAQQAWALAQRSRDASQALVTRGVAATVLEEGGTCFGLDPAPAYVPCSANDANQRWLLLDDGLVRNEQSSQCLGLAGQGLGMRACEKVRETFWGIQAGVLFNADSTCLDANNGLPVLKPCNFSTSRHFVFGLSKGM